MYLGRVIGTVVSTSKNQDLVGMKLLIVEKLNERLERTGSSERASVRAACSAGEIVIVSQGSSARYVFKNPTAPIDKAIVGIVDTVEVGG